MPGTPWTETEVEATVDAYFRLYDGWLRGVRVNKKAAYRHLNAAFPSRTEAAFERKMQNVSACLERLDVVWLEGLLPARNTQKLLQERVTDRVIRRRLALESFALAPPDLAKLGAPSIADALSAPPNVSIGSSAVPVPRIGVDFAAREALNRELGRAGEEWVVRLERRVLEDAGRSDLARHVEHSSVSRGDGLGFDVRSFDPRSREERFIEVKTTRAGIRAPFFLTPNELQFSKANADCFLLYRLHQFGARTKLYILKGDVSQRCELHPATYRAWPKSA